MYSVLGDTKCFGERLREIRSAGRREGVQFVLSFGRTQAKA